MRTTVDLPDDLLREAKERAARSGQTLSSVVSDALRARFAVVSPQRQTAALPVASGRSLDLPPGLSLDRTQELLDYLEGEDRRL